ncbi:MAG: hypothetical protein ABR589_11055 [Chthoniobacterales bacterium]
MRVSLLAVAVIAVAATVEARVDRIEVIARSDVLDAKPFGDAGPYEKVVGKVHFKVKASNKANQLIVDLDKSPRDENGDVGFASDFYILRPKEAARASEAVLLEVPNRGGKGILATCGEVVVGWPDLQCTRMIPRRCGDSPHPTRESRIACMPLANCRGGGNWLEFGNA